MGAPRPEIHGPSLAHGGPRRSLENQLDDRGRARAAAEWWRSLTAGWRLNIGLYALAAIALVALVVSVATGGGQKPKQVEVATQARPTTTPPTLPRPTTTLPAATTTTVTPTTVGGPATTAAPAVGGRTATTRATTGGAPATTTTTAPPVCRNSTDPRCGDFRWDPLPNNQPLTVNVSFSPAAPKAGDSVTFTVEVSDPDHAVTSNCAVVEYGDGYSEPPAPCPVPTCGPAHGPWDPPAAQPGTQRFTYSHIYAAAGSYTARFVFHTDKDTRCPQPDPYGNTQAADKGVVVVAPPAGQ